MYDGVGRLLGGDEVDPTTGQVQPEADYRTAFVIPGECVLTAWHCALDLGGTDARCWIQFRGSHPQPVTLPLRYEAHSASLDVAVMVIDLDRLGAVDAASAAKLLAGLALPIGVDCNYHDDVRVEGFPVSSMNPSGHSLGGRVHDVRAFVGSAQAIKLHVDELASASPEEAGGLSGGPVLRQHNGREQVIGLVRSYPSNILPVAEGEFGIAYRAVAIGGALIVSRISDMVTAFPRVAEAIEDFDAELERTNERLRRLERISAKISDETRRQAEMKIVDFYLFGDDWRGGPSERRG
jgi:hypothetical protein